LGATIARASKETVVGRCRTWSWHSIGKVALVTGGSKGVGRIQGRSGQPLQAVRRRQHPRQHGKPSLHRDPAGERDDGTGRRASRPKTLSGSSFKPPAHRARAPRPHRRGRPARGVPGLREGVFHQWVQLPRRRRLGSFSLGSPALPVSVLPGWALLRALGSMRLLHDPSAFMHSLPLQSRSCPSRFLSCFSGASGGFAMRLCIWYGSLVML
jgi:hypothetical protein